MSSDSRIRPGLMASLLWFTGTVMAPAHYVHTGLLLPHDVTQDYHSKKDSGIFIIL